VQKDSFTFNISCTLIYTFQFQNVATENSYNVFQSIQNMQRWWSRWKLYLYRKRFWYFEKNVV